MDTALYFDYASLSSQLSNCADSEVIGHSSNRTEIRAWRTGSLRDRPVLIVAGQHGDEACGMLAAARIIRRLGQATSQDQPAAWIIPCLNPDAAVENKRKNSQGLDLNRDHLERLSPEVRCLHNLIRRIKPRCVLDLHCFPSRRRWMKKLNVEHSADLLVDWSTGPAALMVNEPCPVQLSSISEWLNQEATEPFVVERYWLRSGRGRLRHSTPDWLDLRNQVSACYRIPTYLIEGREPLPQEIGQHERTIDAMFLAVTGILHAFHASSVSVDKASSRSSRPLTKRMPTQFKFQSREAIRIHLRDRIHQQAYVNAVGTKHSDCTLPSHYVRTAQRMWIPKSLNGVISHLQRLQAPLHDGEDLSHENGNGSVELIQFRINGCRRSRNTHRNDRDVRVTQTQLLILNPQQFVVLIPSIDDRAYWNALVDPRHKFSICRMHQRELRRPNDDRYPILFQYQLPKSIVELI